MDAGHESLRLHSVMTSQEEQLTIRSPPDGPIVPKMNRYTGTKRHHVVVHDAHGLKNFWEEIIETYAKKKQVEDSRLTRSALSKLRREWAQRLEGRIKMLQKTNENPTVQASLLPIETFQPMHKTAA